ncbi:phosphatase PAP2 family protein [Nigerium sp.]|uniref:phosphatase PAP2 family protein n=1 Tax=Nigerium sp. TaxID=2042655 RepID=UPI003221E3D4
MSTPAPRPDARLARRPPDRRSAAVILATALVVCLGLAIWLTHGAEEVLESVSQGNGIALWDRPVLTWAESVRTPTLNGVIAWYSNTGGPLWQPIVSVIVVAFLCWRWRDATPFVLTAVAAGGALAITYFGKRAVGRVRPPLAEAIPPYEYSPSFPSGHTLNATVIAGILCYLILRHTKPYGWGVRLFWVAFFGLYALTMGLTRVYLGHHWLTDVFAGWLLGFAWVAVVIALHRIWRAVRHREEGRPIEEERAAPALRPGPASG